MKPTIHTSFQGFIPQVLFYILLLVCHTSISQTDSLAQYLQLGMEQQKVRDHEEAVNTFLFAIEKFSIQNVDDSIQALTNHRLGISQYRLKNRRDAINAWEKAIDHRQSFLDSNHIDIIKTHINIANAHLTLDEYRNATTSLHKALELLNSQKEKDLHNLGRVYESLGRTAQILGEFESAIEYLSQSYALKKDLFTEEPWELINITTRLFDLYKDIDDPNRMLTYALLSLKYAEATPNDGDQYYYDLANSHNNLGIAYSSNFNSKGAIDNFEKSLRINKNYNERAVFLGFNYNNLILEYNRLGEYQKALVFANKAKEIFTTDPSLVEYLAETYVEEGDVFQEIGDDTGALKAYHSAIQQMIVTSDPMPVHENPSLNELTIGSRFTLMDALYKKASSQFKLKKFQNATETTDILLEQVYNARKRISDRDSKKYLLESTKKFFELGVEIQYQLYRKSKNISHISKAISLFDASKASILYDALAQNALSSDAKGMQDLIDKERQLFTQLTNLEFDLLEAKNEIEENVLKDSMLNYRSQISIIRDSIFRLSNSKLDMQWDESNFTIGKLQNLASDTDQYLIQYFMGAKNTYAISVSKDLFQFKLIDSSITIKGDISNFLEVLKNYQSSAQDYVEAGLTVYRRLIQSMMEERHFSKLFIIPDDIISFIPFEALPVSPFKTGGFKEVDFLLEQSSVRYASSVSVFNLQKQAPPSSLKKAFAGMSSDYKNMPDYSEMSMANTELLSINDFIQGQVYINEDASKEQFLTIQNQYSAIHLSLHGIVDLKEPSLSYLQFPSSPRSPNNGRLHAAEVYNLNLNQEMLVLSACETGSGLLAKGEGILSLAHAFAYAGVQSTVMSLWRIPSSSTATILELFYTNMKAGADKEAALRMAKLKYLDQTKASELLHPFYWAALVQYGNPEKIDLTTQRIPGYYLGMMALLLAAIYFIFRSRSWASSW